MVKGERREEGVGLIEAPRGTLFHHYRVNKNDQVVMANLIVSTTNNNEPMNRAVQKVAQDHLSGKRDHRGAAEPRRSGHPGLRPVPVLRHPRPGPDAAGVELFDCDGQRARPQEPGVKHERKAPRKVLLIGYGNPGRLDDGLGPALAAAVEKLAIPGVTVDADYQLNVEDAAASPNTTW